MLQEAELKGRARVEELTGVPERLLVEAEQYSEQTRTEADRYAEEQRRSADEQARETAAAAKRQADATRMAAEERVREIEEAGRTRHEELREETRALEEGREQLVAGLERTLKGLRKATGQLEHLIRETAPTAETTLEGERPRFGFLRRRDETVYDALRPSAQNPNGRDELYEQAKELGIRGRSRMSREELEAAVEAMKQQEEQ
jgi:hypothetical protein